MNQADLEEECKQVSAQEQLAANAERASIKYKSVEFMGYRLGEVFTGKISGVTDMEALGERQIIVDCDVIQADGGTRCASITGGFVALYLACRKLVDEGVLDKLPLTGQVAAVSVGIWEDEPILDLAYQEDSHAIVDANFIMTDLGEFVEIQGTGEGRPFTKEELNKLMSLARRGVAKLCREQRKITGEIR